MKLSQLEIDRRAQVLCDYITLSTLESELQDAEDSGAYDAGSELEDVIKVMRRAVDFANGDAFNEAEREDKRQGRELPDDWEAGND